MSKYRHLIFIIIVALLIPIIPFLIIGEMPGERWLSFSDENAVVFGLSGIGILAADILLPIPSSIIGTLLGARLGIVYGGISTWLGLMLGNLLGYAIGKLFLSGRQQEIPQTPTLLVVFLSRPVPVLAEAVMFIAGAEKLRLLPVLISSAIGNAIYSVVLTANGALLLPDDLVGLGLVIPMLLPVSAWMIWRFIATKK